ncbi:MAG: radical SAM protein [Acidobacteriota bacterium]
MEGLARPPKYRFYLPADHSVLGRVQKRLALHRAVPRFPTAVQIQTRTGCNADCCFCPYGETADIVPKGRMADDLFLRIVAECEKHGVRRISPYLMNEPFIDVELLDRVAVIKKNAPSCKVCITTNGEPMRPRVIDRMLAEGGVHRIYVSVQGIDKEAYEKTMRGPKLERVMENVDYLVAEMTRRRLTKPKVTITMVNTALIDADKALRYWAERGVEAKATRLENRGGNIDVYAPVNGDGTALAKRPMTAFLNCTRLMRQAFVLHDGRVTLCCTDYHQTTIIGDLRARTLHDVWNAPEAATLRRDFIKGDLSRNPLCAGCTIAERISS